MPPPWEWARDESDPVVQTGRHVAPAEDALKPVHGEFRIALLLGSRNIRHGGRVRLLTKTSSDLLGAQPAESNQR